MKYIVGLDKDSKIKVRDATGQDPNYDKMEELERLYPELTFIIEEDDEDKDKHLGEETSGVTITRARYRELLNAENTLEALESAGVDNWEGYDEALEDMEVDEED